MKKISFLCSCLIATLSLFIPSLSHAGIEPLFSIHAELELQDGKKITGFLTSYGTGCLYYKKANRFFIGDTWMSGSAPDESVLIVDEFFFNKFTYEPNPNSTSTIPQIFLDEPVPKYEVQPKENYISSVKDPFIFYKNIYKLNYLPTDKIKAQTYCPEGNRYNVCENPASLLGSLPFLATSKFDEMTIQKSSVKKARVLGCENFNRENPIITLEAKEIAWFQKPATAVFATEHPPIILISYNAKFDTPQKLADLLNNFLNTKNQSSSIKKNL